MKANKRTKPAVGLRHAKKRRTQGPKTDNEELTVVSSDDSCDDSRRTLLDSYFLRHDVVKEKKHGPDFGGWNDILCSTSAVKPSKDADLDVLQLQSEGLTNICCKNMDDWIVDLSCGFNVMLTGIGSKRVIIDRFARYCTELGLGVLLVDGLFPGLKIQDFCHSLSSLVGVSFEHDPTTDSFVVDLGDSCELERLEYVLAINSLDGSGAQQHLMMELLKKVAVDGRRLGLGVVASTDNVNSSLLWEGVKMVEYRWVYYNCSTFSSFYSEPYKGGRQLARRQSSIGLSSIENVVNSLTSNSRSVFMLLAETYVELLRESAKKSVEVDYDKFYGLCRSKFLVSSEQALHSQLVELRDHNIIKSSNKTRFEKLRFSYPLDVVQLYLQRHKGS